MQAKAKAVSMPYALVIYCVIRYGFLYTSNCRGGV